MDTLLYMQKLEKISIIIPTKNRPKELSKCLESLCGQTLKPHEVVIVDNSKDQNAKRTISIYKTKLPIYYCHESKQGISYARNSGIKFAKYDILGFIDDDCVADRGWVKEVLLKHKGGRKLVLKGRNINRYPQSIIASVEHFSTELFFQKKTYYSSNNAFLETIDTKNLSIRKSLIQRYGLYFDKKFIRLGDVDFGYRIRQNNIDILFNPAMLVSHASKNNLINHFIREIKKGRGLCLLDLKWEGCANQRRRINILYKYDIYNKINDYQNRIKERTLVKLKKQILKNKNTYFIIFFNILCYLSLLTVRIGYVYETINQKLRSK